MPLHQFGIAAVERGEPLCIRAVQREAVRVQVDPVAELRFVDIFVQHRPDGEDAARVLDALAYALDHRGGNLDLAGILGWAKLQDIAIVWERHGYLVAAGDEHSADRERAQPGRTWAAGPETPLRRLAFMNDLDIVAVRIKYPCRIIAEIVFEPGLRRFLALASSGNSRFVKRVYLSMVFRYKSNMHGLGIGLSFFEPEKSAFAITKTLQIGVSVSAFVICKVCDPKRLHGLGVKGD